MRRRLERIILPAVFTAIILTTGCIKVGPDYERPMIVEHSAWRFAATDARNVSNTEWWHQFDDSVLDDLIEEAIERNLDIRESAAIVDQYMGKYGTSRANLLPQANLNFMYNNLISGGQSSSSQELPTTQSRSYTYAGASIQWQIDLWGQLRRGLESAEAELLMQASARDSLILSVVSETARQYVSLRSNDRALELTNDILSILKEEIRIAQAKVNVGYITEVELLQAKSEYDRRSSRIPYYKKNIAQSEHALSLLLGRKPGTIKRGKAIEELKLPAVPAGLPSDLLKRRPDINQAEQNLISATAKIGYNIGNYFPQVNLLSNFGSATTGFTELFTPPANFISLGGMIMGPILSMGKNAGMVQSSEAAAEAAVASFRKSVLNGFKEFEDALVSSKMLSEQSLFEAKRLEAAKRYIYLSKLQFDEGYTPYITVLDAMRQTYDAEIDLLNSRQSTIDSYIDLYKSMGGGWIISSQEKAKIPRPRAPAFYP